MSVNNVMRLAMTAMLFSIAVFASGQGKFVLVVDDLGNQRSSGREIIESPWITTVAIMPERPYTRVLADYAHQLGKEIIVHAPMSNLIDFPLGPLGLDRRDGEQQIVQNVAAALESVPYAVGLSNHMGSRLTQDSEAMGWVMHVLRRNNMYFFDSRTVANSVAWKIADRYRVPWARRSIFLDHEQNHEFMLRQWQMAWQRVEAGEIVTVICHPYPETISFLAAQSQTEEQRSKLVPLSSILYSPKIAMRARYNMPIDAHF